MLQQWELVFITGLGSFAIHFIDIESNVVLKPERLKTRADRVSQLTRFGLPVEGAVSALRWKLLTAHLKILEDRIANSAFVQVHPPLQKSTSVCAASKDILLCANDGHRGIIQVKLEYSGVGIAGAGLRLVDYPAGVSSIESTDVQKQSVYFVAVGLFGGLYACGLSGLEVDQLLENSS